MSVLWDTARLKGSTDIVIPGETITGIFWKNLGASFGATPIASPSGFTKYFF
jgi:hypothetical protein